METVVVALVVGAFGGFAGAAIGPFLGHVFNGWERRDVRRERRREQLREMLQEAAHGTTRYHRAAFRIHVQKTIVETFPGAPQANGLQAFTEVSSILSEAPGTLWQPYRIRDRRLAEWAQELNETGNVMRTRLTGITPFSADDGWWKETERLLDELEALARKIVLRLDELDW